MTTPLKISPMLNASCISNTSIKVVVLSFLLLLLSVPGYSVEYPEKMIFQNVIANSDIGVGEVEAIVQDRDGFMFFGGRNGLLRYDAYDFLQITIEPDPQDASKPTNVSQTVDLFVDSRDRLWVATRLGLYQYDREREVLRRLKARSGVTVDFDREVFNHIAELADGTILVTSYTGLYEINPETWEVKQTRATGNEDGPITERIHAIFIDKQGIVWMGSDGGVNRYDPTTRKYRHIIPYGENPEAPKENSIQTIKPDKNGHIWAGASNGLYRINPETFEVSAIATTQTIRRVSPTIFRRIYFSTQKGFCGLARTAVD